MDVRYFLTGINLRDPQDLELYRQLLDRRLEPSPYAHNVCDNYGWGAKAVSQMHIWFAEE